MKPNLKDFPKPPSQRIKEGGTVTASINDYVLETEKWLKDFKKKLREYLSKPWGNVKPARRPEQILLEIRRNQQ